MAQAIATRRDSLGPITTTRGRQKEGRGTGGGGDTLSCCFSFAAYAKALIHHLQTVCNITILPGLSDAEFSLIESSLRFTFPPDLGSVLREGLPSSPDFPNWRLLIPPPPPNNHSMGPRPIYPHRAQHRESRRSPALPVLVPVYRHFYIPSTPDNAAGNPVFSVPRGGGVYMAAFDLAGLFRRCFPEAMRAPAWAATAARRIEVWTDLAEATGRRRRTGIRRAQLGGDGFLEGVVRRLREGGWGEEEVREMMMMDGRDRHVAAGGGGGGEGGGFECHAEWCVRELSLKLLRAGWSTEEVAYSLGYYNSDGGLVGLPHAVECL